jgi:hypothetical protein
VGLHRISQSDLDAIRNASPGDLIRYDSAPFSKRPLIYAKRAYAIVVRQLSSISLQVLPLVEINRRWIINGHSCVFIDIGLSINDEPQSFTVVRNIRTFRGLE